MPRSRIALNEISLDRIGAAVCRRVSDIPERVQWSTSHIAKTSRERVATLRDQHAGETCVLICNGPSLNKTDMSLVREFPTFCMNRAYLMFDEWGFVPTYFVAIAEQVLTQFPDDILRLPMPKFIDYKYRDLYPAVSGVNYLRLPPSLADRFTYDLSLPMTTGGTVTYATLQIAHYMGFKKAVIIGMDHRFSQKGVPNTTEVRTQEEDKDHVHPNYFPKGMKWGLPDLVRSEIAYELARDAYNQSEREIIDATVDGACQVFKKMDLSKALAAD